MPSQILHRAPASVQERLVAANGSLPAAERRSLVRSLAAIASFVAPDNTARHPPMLFEESRHPGEREAPARRGVRR
jgi:hypothetical protein